MCRDVHRAAPARGDGRKGSVPVRGRHADSD
jgi:hypothetical protein